MKYKNKTSLAIASIIGLSLCGISYADNIIQPRFNQTSATNSRLALQCQGLSDPVPIFSTGGSESGGFVTAWKLPSGNGSCTVGTLYRSPDITKPIQFIAGDNPMNMNYVMSNGNMTSLTFTPASSAYHFSNDLPDTHNVNVTITWDSTNKVLSYTESTE